MATASEILAKIETAIEARVDGGLVEAYSVGGVDFRLSTIEELIALRDRYAALASSGSSGPGPGGGRFALARRRAE